LLIEFLGPQKHCIGFERFPNHPWAFIHQFLTPPWYDEQTVTSRHFASMSRRNSSVVAVDPEQQRKMSFAFADNAQMTADANKATQAEQKMTLMEGIRLYPKAVAWSVLLSAAIIMEGFDKVLIANLLAVPAFKQRFGSQIADGSYEVTAAWQAGLTNGAYVGEMLGLMINGIIADRLGYKKTMIGALFFVNLAIFVVFFSQV
jgi:SP family general alpha glucoside:H+ symporter-like MFS transporter